MDKTVVARLRLEISDYLASAARAGAATKELGRELSGAGRTGKADLDKIGKAALVTAGSLTFAAGLSAKAALDWESAWAGVTKTVDGTAGEMAELETGLRDLAKELPATHGEIAAVAEAAGQLGIQRDAIVGFTRTMVDLGETTNLTADQAATSMARMANIMGTSQGDVRRMASTLVALGNAGASTESEILDMAMRIAGAAEQVGITEAATLGFANALSSVGVEAEAGGTAISRVFSTIATEVADGGEALDEFARVAGMSSEDFRRAFQEDAAGATIAFIEGLSRIKGEGENVFAVLKDLELGDIRVRDALLRAASAGDLFRESLALGAEEWERNNALTTEAEKRYETTAAKLEVARNQVVDLAINVGDVLLPAISGAAGGLSTVVQGLDEMPGPLKAVGLGIGGAALAGLGMVSAAALLLPKLQALRAALIGMGAAGRVASAAMPWLAAAAAAIGVVSYALGQNAKEAELAEEQVKGYTDAIREAGDASAGTEARLADVVAAIPALATAMDDAGVKVSDVADAMRGSDEEWAAMRDGLLEAAEAAGVTGLAMEAFKGGLDGQRQAALDGAENAKTLGRVLDDTGAAADGAAGGIDDLTGGLEENAEAAEEARQQFQELLDAYRASVDPLFGMLDALDANRGAQAKLAEAIAANSDNVDDNNVSLEEMNALYRDVAQTALDVEVAARDLAFAIADGTVELDQGKAMLAEWVAQGLITEDQAANIAYQFAVAAGKADEFAGDYVAKATVTGADGAIEKLSNLAWWLDAVNRSVTARIQVQLNNPYARVPGFQLGAAEGGLIPQYRAAGGLTVASGPRGTDIVPLWATPGEFVMQKSAVARIGVPALEAMNAGRMFTGTSSPSPVTSGGSTQVYAPVFQIDVTATPGTNGRRVGQDIVDVLGEWSRSNGPLPTSITGG